MKRGVILLAVFFLQVTGACAEEDLKTILDKVVKAVDGGNYSLALNELSWAKQEIEKKNAEKLLTFFPDQLKDFTGSATESNTALGMLSIERQYTKGDENVKVSLTGSASGGQGLGAGIAGLGQMAAMLGGLQGTGLETLRIAGRTAQLEVQKDSNSASLTVFLESGSFLNFESINKADAALVKSLAEAFKIADLDLYLKGSSAS